MVNAQRPQSEPLAHMSQEERERYADRLDRMAERANGSLGQHIRNAATVARGEAFYAEMRW